MTSFMLTSIVTEHPELIETGKLILKQLAASWNCEIYWFYREAGHSCGLVDEISSFGCKKILREVTFGSRMPEKWLNILMILKIVMIQMI